MQDGETQAPMRHDVAVEACSGQDTSCQEERDALENWQDVLESRWGVGSSNNAHLLQHTRHLDTVQGVLYRSFAGT